MQLALKNPLVFFDIESTGLNIATDRIVEISAVKVMPDGRIDVKTKRINPTIPISPEAQKIHGISNEDVKDCPKFSQIAKSLAQWLTGCDIAGYNSLKFDIPMLSEEFLRCGEDFDFRKRKLIDVQNIFHKMEQRTLSAAYKFYCGKNLENAHSAEADTMATYEVLMAQLDKYPDDLQNDVKFLADFSSKTRTLDYAGRVCLNDQDVPVFNFGKHKGIPVATVFKQEPSYYDWIQKGEFTRDTKRIIEKLYIEAKRNEYCGNN